MLFQATLAAGDFFLMSTRMCRIFIITTVQTHTGQASSDPNTARGARLKRSFDRRQSLMMQSFPFFLAPTNTPISTQWGGTLRTITFEVVEVRGGTDTKHACKTKQGRGNAPRIRLFPPAQHPTHLLKASPSKKKSRSQSTRDYLIGRVTTPALARNSQQQLPERRPRLRCTRLQPATSLQCALELPSEPVLPIGKC